MIIPLRNVNALDNNETSSNERNKVPKRTFWSRICSQL